MAELAGKSGFVLPRNKQTHWTRRAAALELVATATLTVCLVVAATAVSLGNRALTRGEFADSAPTSAVLPSSVSLESCRSTP